MRIGFTCGSYDLLHAGHYLALKESRRQCDYLIVGLQTDPTIDRKEKNKPVQSLGERLVQLQGCRYVDEVWVYETEDDLRMYLNTNCKRIDVRFLGEDWRSKEYTAKGLSTEVVFTSRAHGFSSTSLRERVIASAGSFSQPVSADA